VLDKIKHEMFAFLGQGNARVVGVGVMHVKGSGSAAALEAVANLAKQLGVHVVHTEHQALSTTGTTTDNRRIA